MNKPKARKDNLVVQDLENELLVYDLKTNEAFSLNETSRLVWQYCDGNNTVADISNLMSQSLRILVSEDFVVLAISELHKNNLLETNSDTKRYLATFDRRKMVKSVSLASLIALPMISAIIAPTAANAASGVCVQNNQPITCEVTLENIFDTCFRVTALGPNAWECNQSECCAGKCINLDPAILGTNGACS